MGQVFGAHLTRIEVPDSDHNVTSNITYPSSMSLMRVVGAGATATYYLVLLGPTYYCAFPAKVARGCENSTAISLYAFNQKKQEKLEVEPLLQDEAVRKKMQTYLT